MRRGLLLVAFLYMLYSIIQWGDTSFVWHLVIIRSAYIIVLLLSFAASFVAATAFRINIQSWFAFMLVLTSLDILGEGAFQGQLYSPYVVITIILFLVAANIYVPMRLVHTTAVSWSTLVLYNIFLLSVAQDEGEIPSGRAWRWILWYNFVLLFVIGELTLAYLHWVVSQVLSVVASLS